MRVCQIFLLLTLTAAWPMFAHGQEATQAADAQLADETGVLGPFANQSAAFQSELERSDYLDFGLGFTTGFDDNTLDTPGNHKSDFSYSILPHIAWKEERTRLKWNLNYAGGFTAHQRFDAYNQASHDFGFETTYRVAEHVEVSVGNRFRMISGFFDPLNNTIGSSAGTVLQDPNPTVITPIANQNTNLTRTSIYDQITRNSAVGASGTFFIRRYKDAPPGTSLIDTDSQEAEAYYIRKLSHRHSVGLTYQFLRLTFSPVLDNTIVNSALATYTIRPQASVVVSFFAGPQAVSVETPVLQGTSGTPAAQRLVSTAAGSSVVWNGRTAALTASVVRAISDGGGLLGPVTLTSFSTVLRDQIARGLSGDLEVSYGHNDSLVTTASPLSALRGTVVGGALVRQMKAWQISAGYTRAWQHQTTTGSGTQYNNHNRAWVSISYQLTRPLGID
jgi:hypothetical protein